MLDHNNLKIGDTLRLLNGNNVKIDSIEVQKLDEKIRVYNFEVKDFHTYFVGKTGVLVHNSCYVKGRIKNNVLDNLIDGSTMKTDDVLDLASEYLGEGYTEPIKGSGRFVSKDGRRVFRMGENDILGKHGGGPHVNFEVLEPNPIKPNKMQVVKNIHIYLED